MLVSVRPQQTDLTRSVIDARILILSAAEKNAQEVEEDKWCDVVEYGRSATT